MRNADLVSAVEASYRVEGDDASWLAEIVACVDEASGRGLGACGYFMDASNLSALRLHGYEASRLKVPLGERTFFDAVPSEAEPYLGGAPAGSGSGQVGGARTWRSTGLYRTYYKGSGAEDIIGVVALDARRIGCVIGVPTPKIARLSARETLALSRLSAHVATGLRLRATVRGSRLDVGADAVLDAKGHAIHAEGEATTPEARQSLRHLARQIDRARTKLRRSDVDEALAVWTALVDGRWTLLDHFDSDGKRFLVARRNDPQVPPLAALTLRERQVVMYTALGHSGKLVSYELGLAEVAISRHLDSAMAKLGVHSRTEVPIALGRLARAALAATHPPGDGAES